LVTNLGAAGSPLAPLNPLTTPLGGGVSSAGIALTGGGDLLKANLASGPVQQVTQQASNAIVPLTATVVQATQIFGSASTLGKPVDNGLQTIGGALVGAGNQVAGASGNVVAKDVGALIGKTGATVASLGGLVNGNAASGGNPLGSLAGAPGGLGGGLSGSAGGNSPLAPITGALNTGGASPLAPVINAVSSIAGGGNDALAPLTGALGNVGNSGSAGSQLTPVAGLLGGAH
jgi:hypothetical protein